MSDIDEIYDTEDLDLEALSQSQGSSVSQYVPSSYSQSSDSSQEVNIAKLSFIYIYMRGE